MLHFLVAVVEPVRLAYPPGNGSYTVNSGGSTEALRTTTSIELVRQYHDTYYTPHNIVISVAGGTDAGEVITVRQLHAAILAGFLNSIALLI